MSPLPHSPADQKIQWWQRPETANNFEHFSQGEEKINIVIPVLGPTGSGKSTFINHVLGTAQMKVGDNTTPCTTQPYLGFIDPIPDFPDLKGYRLALLDTPGFDDTYGEHIHIVKHIADWLDKSCRQGSLVGGVLYLHDISAKRFGGTVRKGLGKFSRLYGDGFMRKTILVTTMWGSSIDDTLERREEELKATHWKSMINDGAEVHRFMQNSKSAWDIINNLLDHVNIHAILDLQIQTELVFPGKTIPQTAAGKELRYAPEQFLKSQNGTVALESLVGEGGTNKQANLAKARARRCKLEDPIQLLTGKSSLPQRFLKLLRLLESLILCRQYPLRDLAHS